MNSLQNKFDKLGVDNAPGQESRNKSDTAPTPPGKSPLPHRTVDFSHGDVDAFKPIPNALSLFTEGVETGGVQAYTEYSGNLGIRQYLAAKLAEFTATPIDGDRDLIITPGSQGALFLAAASLIGRGTKVAIVQPDYFANRKLVDFLDGELIPVQMHHLDTEHCAGLDLLELENAFKSGAEVFLFSNPNNPVGVVYSEEEICHIAELAKRYSVTVIVDQLYSRLLYEGQSYTHLRARAVGQDNIATVIGPSKTESMSGYRVGVAVASPAVIQRMEKLQAIVSLRASGYNQAVLKGWFSEPAGWMQDRIKQHQTIRDDLVKMLRSVEGLRVRTPQAGSYLFPELPDLTTPLLDFVRILRLQADVIVTPGVEFSPHATQSVRLNFSQDREAAVDACERLVNMIAHHRR